jgi:hypothetical protein
MCGKKAGLEMALPFLWVRTITCHSDRLQLLSIYPSSRIQNEGSDTQSLARRNSGKLSITEVKLPSFGLSAPLPGFAQGVSAQLALCLPKLTAHFGLAVSSPRIKFSKNAHQFSAMRFP